MSIAWGIMVLALLGADGPEEPVRPTFTVRHVGPGGNLPVVGRLASNVGVAGVEPEQISYELRVIDMPAAEWREAHYRRCTRVGREGRSTVWTADEKTVALMLKSMQGSTRTNVVQAPKVTAFAGAEATIDTKHRRAFVVDVDRVEGGQADALVAGFRPSVDEISEGLRVSMSGRRTSKGVRAHVKADSTWVGHVARARTRETVPNKGFGTSSIEADLQLPQVVEAKVEGDYEIPEGNQLLVSLGTATSVDERDHPVVMERLLLVAARPILTEAEEVRMGRPAADKAAARTGWVPATRPQVPHIDNGQYKSGMVVVDEATMPKPQEPSIAEKAYADVMAGVAAPAPRQQASFNHKKVYTDIVATVDGGTLPKRMPPLPSRTPMEPIGPDGKVVELPPLPDDFVAEAEALDKSAGPKASPQAPAVKPSTRFDPLVAPARLEPSPVGRSMLRLDGAELASGRTQLIRIPLGGRLAIEVKARLVPAEQPE